MQLCDREIVKECVSIWFGSQEAFEDSVRSQVSNTLARRLTGQVFNRGWCLAVSLPLLWTFLDQVSTWAAGGYPEMAIENGMEGFVLWFLCCPIFADFSIWLAFRYCRRAASRGLEVLKNLGVLFLAVFGFTLMAATFTVGRVLVSSPSIYRAGIFGGFWCILAFCHFLYKAWRFRLTSHSVQLRASKDLRETSRTDEAEWIDASQTDRCMLLGAPLFFW